MRRQDITLLIFILCFQISHPETQDNKSCQEKPIFISLGNRCIPALILKHYNLRSAAYPFDWMLSDTFDNFFKMLETDFENFISKDSLIIDKERPFIVRDQATNFGYSHDFPVTDPKIRYIAPNFLDAFESIKEKYNRRIKRFLDILISGRKIIFLRFEMGEGLEHALKIQNFIHTKYPLLNFYCIELSFSKSYQNAWSIPGIKNFYIDPQAYEHLDWNNSCWGTILKGIEDLTNCSTSELETPQPKDTV